MPTETPVPPPELTATHQPAEATATAPAETSPEEPSEGSPSAPAETPAPPAEAPDEAPEAAEPTPETPEEPQGEEEPPPPSPESSPLILNWGVFLNTVIVTLSYAWICCGVCGLVGTPLAFLLFYVWGKRRLRRTLGESGETEQPPETDQTE